jgi:hypothetical protein
MTAQTITIGEIIEIVEKQIFLESGILSNFDRICIEREKGLKNAIELCFEQIMQLSENALKAKLTQRQELKVNQCNENLVKYIDELANELNKEKIQAHCRKLEENKISLFKQAFDLDMIFLISNSFHTAVTTNILWAPHVTIHHAIEISKGQLDLNELGKHLPQILKHIKKDVLTPLKKSRQFSSFHQNVLEAIKCHKKKYYRGSNLILITTIEGMVRKLATFLSVPHNLPEDFSEEKYISLNNLLRDVNWKSDIEIEPTKLQLIIGESRTQKERHQQFINNEKITVDLNTRLDFLKARFKDDRDLILHGSNQDYNQDWNSFLNFSALYETYLVCNYYEKKYGS